ncbi:Alpha/Beta hydrolase protein [Nemania sp. NC0429]|nr:Alpha/Beta hydrolase protein [Nemania sp. NC0429]
MKRLPSALVLLTGLGCSAVSCRDPGTGMVYGFDTIKPSAKLTWTPCFDNLGCSKLEVPVDYSNKGLGTASVAFIKLAGQNATEESPSIVLIPGGPGGSGVDLLLSYRALLGQIMGEQYNYVSFDPRGVNNSGLGLDCFSGDAAARSAFNRAHSTGVTNSSSLEEQYDSSSIYGKRCNDAVKSSQPHGYYVTTPAVAHDLLTFVEAEAVATSQPPSEAKLWAYAVSYGTVIGTTFASLFPKRVGRMVLDGVLNGDGYYKNDWSESTDQMDETIAKFSSLCHSAGSGKCSFWASSPAAITTKLNGLLRQLQSHPVPISGAQVTYSDLKTLMMNTVYTPVAFFPGMADALHQLENGDGSALAGLVDSLAITSDAGYVIRCVDSYRRNSLSTIGKFKNFVKYTVSKSKYLGDIWPIYVETVLCGSIRPQLPDSMVFQGQIGTKKPTSFPILFASNTIDPVTPLKSARDMSARFPGSVLLLQEAIGHTIVSQGGSNCYFGYVQAYLGGVIPPSNITCPQQYTPFIDGSILG